MDQGTLVARRLTLGLPGEMGIPFVREFGETYPVIVAFWLKERDRPGWRLRVCSDRFDGIPIQTAYLDAYRVMKEVYPFDPDPFRLSLIRTTDPTVKAALEIYKRHLPRIPLFLEDLVFGGIDAEAVYLVQGPTGDYTMPSGREALDQIIDQEAAFYQQHGRSPRKIKLPVMMAYDLAKCGRDQIGEISGRVFKEGIVAFEKEGIHGLSVEIVRDAGAKLQLE